MTQSDINSVLEQLRKHYSGTLDENISTLKSISKLLGDIIDGVANARVEIPSWKKFSTRDFRENYCHYSGEPSNGQTTFAKPILRKNLDKAKEAYI